MNQKIKSPILHATMVLAIGTIVGAASCAKVVSKGVAEGAEKLGDDAVELGQKSVDDVDQDVVSSSNDAAQDAATMISEEAASQTVTDQAKKIGNDQNSGDEDNVEDVWSGY